MDFEVVCNECGYTSDNLDELSPKFNSSKGFLMLECVGCNTCIFISCGLVK